MHCCCSGAQACLKYTCSECCFVVVCVWHCCCARAFCVCLVLLVQRQQSLQQPERHKVVVSTDGLMPSTSASFADEEDYKYARRAHPLKRTLQRLFPNLFAPGLPVTSRCVCFTVGSQLLLSAAAQVFAVSAVDLVQATANSAAVTTHTVARWQFGDGWPCARTCPMRLMVDTGPAYHTTMPAVLWKATL